MNDGDPTVRRPRSGRRRRLAALFVVAYALLLVALLHRKLFAEVEGKHIPRNDISHEDPQNMSTSALRDDPTHTPPLAGPSPAAARPNATAGAAAGGGGGGFLHACTCLTADDPRNAAGLPAAPARLRWLHIPKTGTSFVATLWSYAASKGDRYIDLAVNPKVCGQHDATAFDMYDYALMRRYPWEVYGAPNLIRPGGPQPRKELRLGLAGGTQHVPLGPSFAELRDLEGLLSSARAGTTHAARDARLRKKAKALRRTGSEVVDAHLTVAAFFRRPADRLVSAFYDGRHSSGFPAALRNALTAASVRPHVTDRCRIEGTAYDNTLECFARFPGIAGCMTRMLTGEACADGVLQEAGIENLPRALALVARHLDFVGLMEEWNESICQFHRLFAGRADEKGGRRRWDAPLQGEFANVHKSTKKKVLGLEHLHGFEDVADTALYEVAKLKFEQMVGGERCYKYMALDEIMAQQQTNSALPRLKVDDTGNICQPLSCSDLGKQCGEWDDGCGKTIICGMCDVARTGLPSTWRVTCVEGQCIDYCPPWDARGYWFSANGAVADFWGAVADMEQREPAHRRDYLLPTEAVRVCESACVSGENGSFVSFVGTGLCRCGATAKMLGANLTRQDFAVAHDLTTMCHGERARKEAVLLKGDTQPICCPYLGNTPPTPPGWSRGAMDGANIEGEYFSHLYMECGAFAECERAARKRGAEMAVFDKVNSMCYLARNLVDLGDRYLVTKDNGNRYFLDLRNKLATASTTNRTRGQAPV